MKSRQEHIDFDRNYCTHYAPKPGMAFKDDFCALGCGASAMMEKAQEMGNQPRMAPCIGGHNCADVHAICPKWERRSLEHAEARADSIEKSIRRMTIVGPVVAWRKKEPIGKQEVIECPACKGRLHRVEQLAAETEVGVQRPRPRTVHDARMCFLDGVTPAVSHTRPNTTKLYEHCKDEPRP